MRSLVLAAIVALLSASSASAGSGQGTVITKGSFYSYHESNALGDLWMREGNQINNYYYSAGLVVPTNSKVTCTMVGTSILCK